MSPFVKSYRKAVNIWDTAAILLYTLQVARNSSIIPWKRNGWKGYDQAQKLSDLNPIIGLGIFTRSFFLTVHVMWQWVSCMSIAFYLVNWQSFLIHIFHHVMTQSYLVSSLLVFPCLSFPSSFLLSQHIPGLPFSWHVQRMRIVFS